MPNFYINFLNKAAKSLLILYDFAVASLADAWIKIGVKATAPLTSRSHPSRMRGLKYTISLPQDVEQDSRIPRGCVD